MARPEKTLKYRFIRSTNENGEFIKADSSYNRLATEVNENFVFLFCSWFCFSICLIDGISNGIARTNASCA